MRSTNLAKLGVVDVERIHKDVYQLTYWNHCGQIGAVALYHLGEGIHVIDCNNPYDNEADRKTIKALATVKFFTELPFSDPPEWLTQAQQRARAEADAKADEEFFKGFNYEA